MMEPQSVSMLRECILLDGAVGGLLREGVGLFKKPKRNASPSGMH